MTDSPANADIVIDVKKYRLRIYKSTLHELGDPMNIQLLIDPTKMHFAIVPVEKKQSGDQTPEVRYLCQCQDRPGERQRRSLGQ